MALCQDRVRFSCGKAKRLRLIAPCYAIAKDLRKLQHVCHRNRVVGRIDVHGHRRQLLGQWRPGWQDPAPQRNRRGGSCQQFR
uniref:Transposase n=1 Tax=Steinernema glaseri TaxID=37863 RepID=A0A1I8A540_9BILA